MATNDAKWFEYTLFDAWCCPIAGVTILNADKNTVVYWTPDDNVTRFERMKNKMHSLSVSDASMNKIRSILRDDKLYTIKNLEDTMVIDGYIHEFYFSDGQRKAKLIGYNIDYSRKEYVKHPNAAFVIDILEQIAGTLVTEGVDRRCFMLKVE